MSTRNGIYFSALILLLLLPPGKKDELLLLSKKYFPENYAVLKEYDETTINDLAHGSSLGEFISDVSTIVHEGYHHYQGLHSSYFEPLVSYRINDTLSFEVNNLKTFPANEINAIVPASTRKKVFRYDTYVDAKDKYHVTRQFGILGLLEECVAYYQSLHTEISLFNYYKDKYGWKKPDPWMEYLSNMASYRYSITEFELFISWYLQSAKTKHPDVYRNIINNKGLKKLFSFLHTENARLASLYDQNRQTILLELKGKVEIRNSYIFSYATLTGKGLYDDEVQEMNGLLAQPEHKILQELLR